MGENHVKMTFPSYIKQSHITQITVGQAVFLGVKNVQALGNETDREALLAFKDQMSQYSAEHVLGSWNNSLHFCKWEGVVCGVRHQRVTILNLKSHGQIGSVSPFIGNLPRVSYKELSDATNGFSLDNLIGAGNYGSVYKGRIREADNLIAVKVMNLLNKGASKSFLTECEVLRKFRHRNLLKILTACSSVDSRGNDFKALVFEYMPNGSLENWLYSGLSESSSRNLNLLQILNIAIDIASALNYLHNQWQTPIIHCDLKPSNVLPDDEMVAHVADFGIAKILHNNGDNFNESEFSSIAIRGSIGYVPPEYGMGAQVSTQGDVYSYGILLLEMLTGKRPNNAVFKDNLNLHSFCKVNLADQVSEIIHGSLLLTREFSNEPTNSNIEQMKAGLASLMEIGVACSSESVTERMTIEDVLLKMHKIKAAFVGIENINEV